MLIASIDDYRKQCESRLPRFLYDYIAGGSYQEAPYDGVDLVYRTSAVRYVSDPYHAFLAEPGPMLSSRISEWLNGTGLFQ
jgi:hypothetical protein